MFKNPPDAHINCLSLAVPDYNLDPEECYLQLLNYLRSADTRQFNKDNEHVLEELAGYVQLFGERLSVDLAYNNDTRHAFYVKKTSIRFKKQGSRVYPFKNCSGHKSHSTAGEGNQKIIHSAKPQFRPLNIAMYEYFIGSKQKTQTTNSYSLLVILPQRSADEMETELDFEPLYPAPSQDWWFDQ